MKCSNSLIGILNFIIILLSIPILVIGVWLSHQDHSDCQRWLQTPMIVFGAFLLLVSIAGLLGSCCRVTWLLWVYLFVMFVVIVAVFAFTIFAFVVTNKGAGEAISGKGYKEYRLGHYSDWLQRKVENPKNWNRIRSCLESGKLCTVFRDQFLNYNADKFSSQKLAPLESGCCKPSNDCNFIYQGPTEWKKPSNTTTGYSNPDCDKWSNDPKTLCFDCQSCKAGLLENIKVDWKKVAIVNIVFLIFLIIVYSIGCCAFRNNRRHHYKRSYY